MDIRKIINTIHANLGKSRIPQIRCQGDRFILLPIFFCPQATTQPTPETTRQRCKRRRILPHIQIMIKLANVLGAQFLFPGGSQDNGLGLPTMRVFRLYKAVLRDGCVLGTRGWWFPQRHGDINGNVFRALAAASCWAGWKELVLVCVVEWAVEFVDRSKEPEPMAVETTHMSAAQTGDQHTVDHLAADDAR